MLDNAFGPNYLSNVPDLIAAREAHTRSRHLPLMLMEGLQRYAKIRIPDFLNQLNSLYLSIKNTAGCRVIIDGSKFPSYGLTLEMIPAIELYVVHLVRDPRATGYSWLRRKPNPASSVRPLMAQHGPLANSVQWIARNVFTEACWRIVRRGRYARIRYEDFVANPYHSTRALVHFVNEQAPVPDELKQHKISIDPQHTVSGNPVRFETGVMSIRPDVEWIRRMKLRDKALITLLLWPAMLRYGYPLLPAGEILERPQDVRKPRD